MNRQLVKNYIDAQPIKIVKTLDLLQRIGLNMTKLSKLVEWLQIARMMKK